MIWTLWCDGTKIRETSTTGDTESSVTFNFDTQFIRTYSGKKVDVMADDDEKGCHLQSHFTVPTNTKPAGGCSTLPDTSYLVSASTFYQEVTCEKESVTVTGTYKEHIDKYVDDPDSDCSCKHIVQDVTSSITRNIQVDTNIGGTMEKVYTGTLDGKIPYTIVQLPCNDCRNTTYTFSDNNPPYPTKQITCEGQTVRVTSQIPYIEHVTTIVDGECVTTDYPGLSSVTVSTSVTENTSGSERRETIHATVRNSGGAHLIFELIQPSCSAPTCDDVREYGTSQRVDKTVTCDEQNVSITGSVPYTTYTRHYDSQVGDCVVDTSTTGLSSVTISVHVSKNETSAQKTYQDVTNHVSYKITQDTCGSEEPELYDFVFNDGTHGPNAPTDNRKIVGICVVSAEHAPDGHARIMSLHNVGELGSYTDTSYRGGWSDTITGYMATDYTTVATILSSSIETVDGGTYNNAQGSGLCPSTCDGQGLYEGLQVYGRTERYTTNSTTTDRCIASPFKANDSVNNNFRRSGTLLSDFGGYENTNEIVTSIGYEDRNCAAFNASFYASFQYTGQTQLGNFESYLPSAAEMAYVLVNMKQIDAKITGVASNKFWAPPVTIGSIISPQVYYWTSDEYDDSRAWSIRPYNGEIQPTNKRGEGAPYVRPFLKLKNS